MEQCAVMDTEEERGLTKKTADLHEKANALLNQEQQDAVQEFVDGLCDLESLFVKKAFCKGCEFAVSFLLETRNAEK